MTDARELAEAVERLGASARGENQLTMGRNVFVGIADLNAVLSELSRLQSELEREEAAAALGSLKKEVARMRGALEQIKRLASDVDSPAMEAWDRARAALIKGNRGSLPRDIMEGGLSEIWTVAHDALRSQLSPPPTTQEPNT